MKILLDRSFKPRTSIPTPENRERLKHISSATLTTALFKRGLKNMFFQDVRPVGDQTENMVGEAFNLRYMPSREDLDGIAVFKDPSLPRAYLFHASLARWTN